ncbi:ATP-binding cassette domain-containing protein [Candidatus Bealeia paramacronuclearis]|uniref:ATP-binding cassette domain-containing protein n=1 Tax=Candidatus Bealeia paramacronuclearis TaxID=1921001 RepID=A0ABZ2C7S3_9PROT|nr:ATP-binding cassette domain-containing protein [Candidatus Bealeia paramacronuclearis]
MLKLENIDVILNQGTSLERSILKNLNLELARGDFLILRGDNGAGKSTVFNVISGHQRPQRGRIFLEDIDITNAPQHKRAEDISLVMQDPRMGTLENMSIEENLSFAYLRGKKRGFQWASSSSRRAFFQEKLSLLGMGLEGRLETLVSHLSGGQRQALSLIMAILRNSKLLLLDEITAALDPKLSESLMELTHKIISENNLTAMMITHNPQHQETYGTRALILKNGTLV